MRAALPTVKLITLATSMQPGLLAEAAGAGADGAIAKTARLERVCALIREVAAGTVFHAFTAAPAPVTPRSDPLALGRVTPPRGGVEELSLEITRTAAGRPRGR